MRILTILLLFAGLCWYGVHRYTHHITHACCAEENTNAALFSKWSEEAVSSNPNLFADLRDSLFINFDKKKDALVITGRYYADEVNNTKYPNLGYARADYIRKQIFDKGYKKSISIDSKLIKDAVIDKATPINAAEFKRVRTTSLAARVEERDGKVIIYFPFNSDNPDQLDPNIGLQIADFIEANKGNIKTVELSGHTDNVGEDDINLALSQQRADVVKNLIVSNGIAAEVITTVAKGETEPQADNETAEGRQLNRRVELILNK